MADDVYSHGHHSSVLRAHELRTAENSAAYLLPHLRPGMTVLDLGAGPGTITADLAAAVAPGEVVGIDRAAGVVDRANDLARERGLPNLTFRTGDAYALEFSDQTFDVVHTHQVLHHLTDPVAALRELRRVTRPGGLVAAREVDFRGMSWYPELPELDEWMDLYQKISRGNGAEPNAGRRLMAWAREAGLRQVLPSVSTWLYADPTQRGWFSESWAERVRHSAFAEQVLERGLGSEQDLERIAAGWERWGADPDGTFIVVSAEILATR